MNLQHYYEEQDAWFSRADRFDGFDRGDLDEDRREARLPIGKPAADDDWQDDIPY